MDEAMAIGDNTQPKNVRWLILSDIHSNMDALTACLAEAKSIGYDRMACLGDLVGYGPSPNEVVSWARDLKKADESAVFVMGNHDESVADNSQSIAYYNPSAQQAVRIQRDLILSEHCEFLLTFPKTVTIGDLQFVHGSPHRWDDYVHDKYDAKFCMNSIDGKICFIGHTHRPNLWKDKLGVLRLVNVGSVGQPRDGHPESCFAIFDTASWEVRIIRVKYDVVSVQEKMTTLHMPEHFIERLSRGR